MSKFPVEIGSIVRSRAGRDQGRLFVVISEIDEDFVLMANGSLRTMDRPKKKRRRHLTRIGMVPQEMLETIRRDGRAPDHEVRALIKQEEG